MHRGGVNHHSINAASLIAGPTTTTSRNTTASGSAVVPPPSSRASAPSATPQPQQQLTTNQAHNRVQGVVVNTSVKSTMAAAAAQPPRLDRPSPTSSSVGATPTPTCSIRSSAQHQHVGKQHTSALPSSSAQPPPPSRATTTMAVSDQHDRPRTPEHTAQLQAAAKAPKSPPPLLANGLPPGSSRGGPVGHVAPPQPHHAPAVAPAVGQQQRTKRTVTIKEDANSAAVGTAGGTATATRGVRGGVPSFMSRGARAGGAGAKHTPAAATPGSSSTTNAVGGGASTAQATPTTASSRWCPPNYGDPTTSTASAAGAVGLTGTGLLVGRYLVVTGGLRASDNVALSTIACYDTKANKWLPNRQQYQTVAADGAAGSGNSGGPSPSSPPQSNPSATLPEPLYGHCCVTHGQRSVWLVGGVSGSHLSRSIVRLTIDIYFANGATSNATPQQSPQPFHTKHSDGLGDFTSAPPMGMVSSAAPAAPVAGGLSGRQDSAASNDSGDEAVCFSVASCRIYQLPFPVAFASCVKLQGALHPVALVIGGLSTVRDSECADMYHHQPSPPHTSTPGVIGAGRDGNGVAAPNVQREGPTSSTDESTGAGGLGATLRAASSSSVTSALQETRRLGMTNRIFALNLDDCSMFRVAQAGETPRPRMMAAAAPVLRRDVSGSYGSIVLFGGITATQAQAVPPPTSNVANSGAPLAGGGGCQTRHKNSSASAPPQPAQSADDPRSVFVASVRYDPRSRTFSLLWSMFHQRSAADPWPEATAGHALCAMPGFTLLLGGTTITTDPADAARTAAASRPVLAMLYDAVSGVAWSEVAVPQAAPLCACVFHRAIVSEDSKDPRCSILFVVGGGTGDVAGAATMGLAANDASTHRPDHHHHNISKALPRGFITRLSIPHGQGIVSIPSEDAPDEFNMQIHIEILKQSAATGLRLSQPQAASSLQGCCSSATPPAGIWDATVDRKSLCIDAIVRMVAEKISNDAELRQHLPRAMLATPAARSATPTMDVVRHVLEHNLLLYSRGSEGERVPLSNDSVLKRMVQRCGLNAMPLVACFIPPIKGYRLLSKLGEGSFGRVYSAMNDETGQFFAVKRVRYMPEQREALLREIRLLRSLDHPNIVKYLGVEVMEDKQVANIFLEYVKMEGCGDLTSLFKRLGNPSMPIIRSHLRQVLAALTYLHSYHIVHQDIKGANVLVGVDVTKLADFGTARQLVPEDDDDQYTDDGRGTEDASDDEEEDRRNSSATVTPRKSLMHNKTPRQQLHNRRETREGTAVFMAPEVLIGGENDEMTTASDIWSVGCLLLEMATGKLPWVSQLSSADRRDALMELRAKLVAQEKPAYPTRADFPPSGVRFLDDCLDYDPRNRKTAAALLSHSFLTDELDDAAASLDAHRYPSPISNTQASPFPLTLLGRQPSDLLAAPHHHHDDASTLENCVETFVDAGVQQRQQQQQCTPDIVPPPPIRRAPGVPMALRGNRR